MACTNNLYQIIWPKSSEENYSPHLTRDPLPTHLQGMANDKCITSPDNQGLIAFCLYNVSIIKINLCSTAEEFADLDILYLQEESTQ